MADDKSGSPVSGGTSVAADIRAYPWTMTPLGHIDTWPVALKAIVNTILASRFPMCVAWGPELVTIYNDAFEPILGKKRAALGRSFHDVWGETWHVIGSIVEKAYMGEATFVEDFPLVIERNGNEEQAYFTFCCSPLRDESDRIVGVLHTVVETTSRVKARRDAKLLNAELAHRLQNTFAMVTAMVDQAFRSTDSKDATQALLTHSITVLGQAHSILSQSSWSSAPLRAIVQGALAPFRKDQIVVSGPYVALSERHSLSLALAVNELATNAVKYGALSVAAGVVSVNWEAGKPASCDEFRFSWVERNGPAVIAPARRGFGSRLLERTLSEDFHGNVQITYDTTGVCCELTTKMKHLM